MRKIIIISISLGVLLITGCSSSGGTKDGANLKKAAQINIQLGAAYLSKNDINLAKVKLTKALDQDPDNALAHSTMALLMEKTGRFDEAEDYYEEAMSLDPKNTDINNNYGTFLCNRSKFEEAQEQFEKAINDPYYKTPAVALINAGKCAMNNSKYKLSESYLRQALRKNAQSPVALYLMSSLGLKTKKYLMARAYIQRYHSLVKPSADSLWIQVQVERALGDKVMMRKLIIKMNKKFPDSDETGLAMELLR